LGIAVGGIRRERLKVKAEKKWKEIRRNEFTAAIL